jgi:hypothetical protein
MFHRYSEKKNVGFSATVGLFGMKVNPNLCRTCRFSLAAVPDVKKSSRIFACFPRMPLTTRANFTKWSTKTSSTMSLTLTLTGHGCRCALGE